MKRWCVTLLALAAACPTAHAATAPDYKLVAPADAKAVAAVRTATRGLQRATIDTAQSFRIVGKGGQVATLVAGQGQAPGASYMGCFVALVQGGTVVVAQTIASGEWEAQSCGRALSIGLLSSGADVAIGAVYEASSPNASGQEPVILRWHPGRRTLAPDAALSQQASIKGATTIAAMRRLVR